MANDQKSPLLFRRACPTGLTYGVDMGHGSKGGQRWVGFSASLHIWERTGPLCKNGRTGDREACGRTLSPGCAPSPGPSLSISWVTRVLRVEAATPSLSPRSFQERRRIRLPGLDRFSGQGLVRASPVTLFLAYSLAAGFVRSLSLFKHKKPVKFYLTTKTVDFHLFYQKII